MTFEPKFLSVEDVSRLHALAIEDQRGDPALRDATLLESAVMTPRQQFDGQFLHPDIPSMAAAYAYHICKNHPFVDGNKRAGTAAMIAFLSDNGWSFDATADQAEPVILSLAAGTLSKVDLSEWVRKTTHEKPRFELRDFFAALTPSRAEEPKNAMLRSPNDAEYWASFAEAADSIPILRNLIANASHANSVGDLQAATTYAGQISLLALIYRIAEDTGYEW